MKSLTDNVSYIIGFRKSSDERLKALKFVLTWLHRYFPDLEIIVVEQDSEQKFDIEMPSYCKYSFLFNEDLYNRSWAFNFGASLTDKDILVFADSDMFMHDADYRTCFEACNRFEVVNPNGLKAINVDEVDSENLSYRIRDEKNLFTAAAGIVFIQRKAFFKIGGWDERFEGWGGEDDEISLFLTNILTSKWFTFPIYHIDHARTLFDGNTQPHYEQNFRYTEEVSTLYGQSLHKYLKKRASREIGNPSKYRTYQQEKRAKEPSKKPAHFILAIIPNAGVEGLKKLIWSWQETKTPGIIWDIMVAYDDSGDNIAEYLQGLNPDGCKVQKMESPGYTEAVRFNLLARELQQMEFDLCFVCNENIEFIKEGWDLVYHETIIRTGYDHLCFYDLKLNPEINLHYPVVKGALACHSFPENIRGDFFTLTPRVLADAGFIDTLSFNESGLEFLDYSWRCCRLGYNAIENPFDIQGSNDYIRTHHDNLAGRIKNRVRNHDSVTQKIKSATLYKQRTYIPYNEIKTHHPPDVSVSFQPFIELELFTALENKNAALNEQIADLRIKTDGLSEQCRVNETELNRLLSEKHELESRNAVLVDSAAELSQGISHLVFNNSALEHRVADHEKQIKNLEEIISQRINENYELEKELIRVNATVKELKAGIDRLIKKNDDLSREKDQQAERVALLEDERKAGTVKNRELEDQIMMLTRKIHLSTEEAERINKINLDLQKDRKNILDSWSFRIGRSLITPIKFIYRLFRLRSE